MQENKQKLTLDKSVTHQIKVPGRLDESHSEWAGQMTISIKSDGDDFPVTTLTGTMDQAALQGLLRRPYYLGLPLISVVFIAQKKKSRSLVTCPP